MKGDYLLRRKSWSGSNLVAYQAMGALRLVTRTYL
jgi:hypothetical protein